MLSTTESTTPAKGISRRRFLGTTAAAAGAALGLGSASALLPTLEVAEAEEASREETFECVCRPNCHAYCRHKVTVRDGRVVKSEQASFPEEQYNRICLRGISSLERIYDPDRIKYPLRRAGERGEDKWERISWEEAIDTIAPKWQEIIDAYGPQALAFHHSGGDVSLLNCWPTITRFTNLLGGTYIDYNTDMGIDHGTGQVFGANDWNGPSSNDPSDWKNSKTIFLWGYNITEANIQAWHFLADALEGGTELVVVDPVFITAASKAHRYVPIRPGSDLALVLAMTNVIISEGLQNEEFLRDKSCAPFLVNQQTGKFLRRSDLGTPAEEGPVDPATGQPTVIDPVIVFDEATGELTPVDDAERPALSGDREYAGIPCRTAWDLLCERVAEYTPDYAAALTDIDAETIVELAHMQSGDLVSNLHGFGNGCYVNGGVFGHALATLASVTGNIGKSGCSFGFPVHVGVAVNNSWLRADLAKIPSGIPTLILPEVIETGKFRGEDFPIKALHFSNSNALSNTVNHNELREKVLPKIDLIVTQDITFNDTVRYSDIVLPTPNYYEEEELVALFFAQHPYMQYSAKAVDPLYEAKTDTEILRLLADKMGIGDKFMPMSNEEACDQLFDTPLGRELGLTFENLKREGVIKVPGLDVMFEGQKFTTLSGRAEFYVESPHARNDFGQELDIENAHLPRWETPAEAWPENPLFEKYPLVVITPKARYRIHGQWFNVPALRELDPEPTTYLNPADAAERGIADGDYVEVFNDRGSYVAKCILSEGVRSGVISTPKGWQRNQHKKGGYQEVTGGHFDPFTVNNSFYETLADVRPWDGEE